MENNKRKTKTAGLIKAIKEKLRGRKPRVVITMTRITLFPRRLARSMAKAKMKKAGIQHVNSSLGWANWREWAAR